MPFAPAISEELIARQLAACGVFCPGVRACRLQLHCTRTRIQKYRDDPAASVPATLAGIVAVGAAVTAQPAASGVLATYVTALGTGSEMLTVIAPAAPLFVIVTL